MQEVAIYILELDDIKANEDKILKELSSFQLMQSKKYKVQEDYLRSIGGFYLINKYTSKNVLRHNKYGKPIKTGEYFNVAHSGKFVVFAKSDVQIGVDIEKIRDFKVGLINYICNEQDAKKIKTKQDFFKVWTLKESLIKCVGTGFAKGSVKDVPIYPIEKRVYLGEDYSSKIELIEDYVLAVCIKGLDDLSLDIEHIKL